MSSPMRGDRATRDEKHVEKHDETQDEKRDGKRQKLVPVYGNVSIPDEPDEPHAHKLVVVQVSLPSGFRQYAGLTNTRMHAMMELKLVLSMLEDTVGRVEIVLVENGNYGAQFKDIIKTSFENHSLEAFNFATERWRKAREQFVQLVEKMEEDLDKIPLNSGEVPKNLVPGWHWATGHTLRADRRWTIVFMEASDA